MPDFLLELLSEEIPARMQARARDDLARLFTAEIGKAGLVAETIETYATPRRLALIARGLPAETQAVGEELKGPRTSAPPQALEGFLRKTGLTQDQLVDRDGIWFAVIDKPGRATSQLLAEAIPAIVRTFPWPKSMRWGAASVTTESLRWVRPLQGIVALFGGDIVACEIDGITSSAETVGHRFHHPGRITIGGADDYAAKLRACHVIVDQEERARIIAEGARAAAGAAGLVLVEDEALLAENAGLTEWPVPLLGGFDPAFLDVPPEVIRLTMATNQKYFALTVPPLAERGEDRSLAPNFICTANIEPRDRGATIVAGNRKVLAARLADAKFFWEQDLKIPLEEQAKKLDQIVFHEKLGTVADKVERVAKLARWLCESGVIKPLPFRGGVGVGAVSPLRSDQHASADMPHPNPSPEGEGLSLADLAEQAAQLCKADLVTGMVGEFPELQGVMGGYYARAQGLPDAVADAIRDHYKPVGQGDDVPTAPVTVAVSLADKLDTLVSFFAIDLKPTGSRDPFALRRASLGIVRLILDNALRLSLREGFLEARRLLLHTLQRDFDLLDAKEWDDEYDPVRGLYADDLRKSAGEVLLARGLDEAWRDWGGEDWGHYRGRIEDCDLKFRLASLETLVGETMQYVHDRLEESVRRAGIRHDLVRAVVSKAYYTLDLNALLEELIGATANKEPAIRVREHNWQASDDLVTVVARVRALQAFVETAEGRDLLAGYKRAANILKKEDYQPSPSWGGLGGGGEPSGSPKGALTAADAAGPPPTSPTRGEARSGLSYSPEPDEAALIAALDSAAPKAADAVAREDFEGAMTALASLRKPVDAFFTSVTVNDPDPAKRSARLDLLVRIRDAVHQVADFSRIEG